ncbi:MAG: type II toxin-antitoxin system HicA family toxin [Patescibacteria group bacterium]
MSRLPSLSGKDILKVFLKMGYVVIRQRSSHVRLINPARPQWPITIPDYKVVGRGLLRKIIRDAGVSTEQFLNLIKK